MSTPKVGHMVTRYTFGFSKPWLIIEGAVGPDYGVEYQLLAWRKSNKASCRIVTIPGIGSIPVSVLATSVAPAA
ncbi:MAG: hypothetical protein ACRBM6_29890 [Geminicoccales bacterium]